MAILENSSQVERIEYDAITGTKEFVFPDTPEIFVPEGRSYHKIITKNKKVIYQTGNQPRRYSQEIIRVKNLSVEEGYNIATGNAAPTSKYFRNKRVFPTKSDYSKRFFLRYFLQLSSDDKAPVLEVPKKEFEEAKAIYSKAKLVWSLSDNLIEAGALNKNSILYLEKRFPQIRMKIYNYVEYVIEPQIIDYVQTAIGTKTPLGALAKKLAIKSLQKKLYG